MKRGRFDIEGDALLDKVTKVHCMSVCIDDQPVKRFVGHKEIRKGLALLDKCETIIAHFGIGYDVPALFKVLKWKPKAIIEDTVTLSCLLFPDIDGGHSLEEWGKRLGVFKVGYTDWCAENGITDPFAEYRPEMGGYCDQDVEVLRAIDEHLLKAREGWDWQQAVETEHQFAKDFTVQGMRGVMVDMPHCVSLLAKMDSEMDEVAKLVEPLLPPRPGTKGQLRATSPPKLCFKKDGTPTKATIEWFDKVVQSPKSGLWGGYKYGKWHQLPTPMLPDGSAREPLVTAFPATLADQQHIKQWLMNGLPTKATLARYDRVEWRD